MSAIELDETDRRILDLLGEDARLSNRALARRLGLVEGTVRSRVRRLTERNLLRFTAITDNRQHGGPRLTFVRIRTDFARAHDIAAQIATIPAVRSAIITLGNFNILAIALFETEESYVDVATNQIATIPGVIEVEGATVIKSLKYNERMAKLS